MYNRYQGNTGRFVRIPTPEPAPPRPLSPPTGPGPAGRYRGEKKPPPYSGGGLERLLPLGDIREKLSGLLPRIQGELETEDLLLGLVLYLMYKESGDKELLIILGAMLFL